MYVICKNGHRYKTTYMAIRKHNKCPICSKTEIEQIRQSVVDSILKHINNEGYKIHNRYKKPSQLLKMTCPNGHTVYMSYSDFKNGNRCEKCEK